MKNLDTLHTSQLGEISILVNTILDEVSENSLLGQLVLNNHQDMKDRQNLSETIKEHLDPVKYGNKGSSDR